MPLPIVFLNIPYRYPHFILCTAYRVTDVIYSIQRKVQSFGLLIWWRYFFPPKESPFVQHFAMITFLFFPPKESSSAVYSDDVTVFTQTKFLSFSILPWWRYSLASTESPMVRHYAMMTLPSPANGKPFGQHYTVQTLLSPAKRKPISSALYHDNVTFSLQKKAHSFGIIPR